MDNTTILDRRPNTSSQSQATGGCVPLSPRPPWAEPLQNQDGRGERGRGEGGITAWKRRKSLEENPLTPDPSPPAVLSFQGISPHRRGERGADPHSLRRNTQWPDESELAHPTLAQQKPDERSSWAFISPPPTPLPRVRGRGELMEPAPRRVSWVCLPAILFCPLLGAGCTSRPASDGPTLTLATTTNGNM